MRFSFVLLLTWTIAGFSSSAVAQVDTVIVTIDELARGGDCSRASAPDDVSCLRRTISVEAYPYAADAS